MSPIRPENRDRYGSPAEWAAVRAAILERAEWSESGDPLEAVARCECEGECGRGTHVGRCPNTAGAPGYGTGSTVVLTIAHLDHAPEHNDPANLRAMCQGCHLHYDREHHAHTAALTRRAAREAAGQTSLEVGGLVGEVVSPLDARDDTRAYCGRGPMDVQSDRRRG